VINRTMQLLAFWCTVAALSISGCGGGSAQQNGAGNSEHEHAHSSTGPHGGSLIGLGDEEYHAELVHDEPNGTVTVYLLDSQAKASVPVDATEIRINLSHDGRGEQFKLAASPISADQPGKSSRFMSNDAELIRDLDREGAGAQIALMINGTPYLGAIEHHHE
jgi:hypothetical protein